MTTHVRQELILASTSTYRRQLLDRLCIPYRAVPHQCDEELFKNTGRSPQEIATTVAQAKARSVASKFPHAYIIGSDQVVDVDGAILGKPGTLKRAHEQLEMLCGRSHRLITALAFLHPDGTIQEECSIYTMTMRSLCPDEIAHYVDFENPLDCAGAYKIESAGISLFERLEGDDFTSIVGLPLMALAKMLRYADFKILQKTFHVRP